MQVTARRMCVPLIAGTARPRWRPGYSALIVCLLLVSGPVLAQVDRRTCGSAFTKWHIGPYDSRSTSRTILAEIENAHFTPEVEMLVRGKTNRIVGPDLTYVLRAVPNHHRAIVAAVGLAKKHGMDQPPGMSYPVECYFIRALEFKTDDFVVHGLYADWLLKEKRVREALLQLESGEELAHDNPNAHFTLGLLYLDAGDHDKALKHAQLAQELGWPIGVLEDRLRALGRWPDPAAQPPERKTP